LVTSIWSRRRSKPSTTPSAQGCHPCLRNVLSPMCPVRTPERWRSGRFPKVCRKPLRNCDFLRPASSWPHIWPHNSRRLR
jgi:hypothetical protein